MLAKRIIPCLDVQNGMVVKGVNFEGIKEVGDPVECAVAYDRQGADEICFLDITATHEGRGTMMDVVRQTAKKSIRPANRRRRHPHRRGLPSGSSSRGR